MIGNMRFDIVTIFPGFFDSVFAHGIVRRAIKEGLVTVEAHDLREFAHDRHRTVDDRPFGGGEGMVLKPEPLAEALEKLGVKSRDQGNKGPREQEGGDEGAEIGDPEERGQGSEGAREQEIGEPEERGQGSEGAREQEGGDEGAEIGDPEERGQGSEGAREQEIGEPEERGQGSEGAREQEIGEPEERDQGNKGPREQEGGDEGAEIGDPEERGQGSEGASHPSVRKSSVGDPGMEQKSTRVILLSAQGRLFTQAVARELAAVERVVLVCGRYEGVDERVNELYCDMELSIGDYVLSGGELAAAVVVDATMRLIPGVLGNEASGEYESFGAADGEIDLDVEGVPRSQHGAGGLLDYPQYTRPAEFGGLRAPEVLMNGDHAEIRRWRREQQLRKTLKNRPELLERATLNAEDMLTIERLRGEIRL